MYLETGSSLRDLSRFFHFSPALKRWAKLGRPFGAEAVLQLKCRTFGTETVLQRNCRPFETPRSCCPPSPAVTNLRKKSSKSQKAHLRRSSADTFSMTQRHDWSRALPKPRSGWSFSASCYALG